MTGPDAIVVAALRIGAAMLVAYLALLLVVRVMAATIRSRPLARAADAITPAVVRRLVAVTTGLVVAVPTYARATDAPVDAPVVMHRLPEPGAPTTTVPSSPPVAVVSPPAPPPPAATWTVERGDNFWTIAARVLQRRRGHAASVGETIPFWHRLIEQNRARLRQPANPNLIYPGQVFELPEAD